MGNCSGRIQRPGIEEPILDLDEILINKAKDRISTRRLTYAEKLCLEKSLKYEVAWNCVDISHTLSKFQPPKGKIPTQLRDVTLFRTKFVNSSDVDQQYTFKTERQTKSTCSISVQKGFTVGGSLNLEFSLPNENMPEVNPEIVPCKISGGLSGQLSWSKTTGQTHEEVLTWSVDSQVRVEKRKTAWAALMIHEENLDMDFEIRTILTSRLENGKIPVLVRRTKDDSLLQILDVPIKDIAAQNNSLQYDKSMPGRLQCVTSGSCNAVYGVEQVIQIETRPLWPSDDMAASMRALHLDPSSVVIQELVDDQIEMTNAKSTELTPLNSTH